MNIEITGQVRDHAETIEVTVEGMAAVAVMEEDLVQVLALEHMLIREAGAELEIIANENTIIL